MAFERSHIFERNVPGSTERLAAASVGIAGCGGLGSNAAVSLVRAGIGSLVLADFDTVELSNLNRQHYFLSDAGLPKVEALAAHLRNINPDVVLAMHRRKLTPRDIASVFKDSTILIEAFDEASDKQWLIESWCKAYPDRPVICGSGVSGIGATSALAVRSSGKIYFVGDGETDSDIGLCSARVAAAANMQANIAIALILESGEV